MAESGLTVEQLKRIKENRQRALDVRASKVGMTCGNFISGRLFEKPSGSAGLFGSSVKRFGPPSAGLDQNTKKYDGAAFSGGLFGNQCRSFGKNVEPSTSVANTSPYKTSYVSGTQLGKGEPVTGKCQLCSRSRFKVEVRYSQSLIALFKTMSSRSYDSETKTWTFDLSDYNHLIQKAEKLLPTINLEPLPFIVRKAFKSQINGTKHSSQPDDLDISCVSESLRECLKPFQECGIKFGISKEGKALLADDMGTGKTIQALGIADYFRDDWPLLVVTPSSVRFNWKEEVLKWLPDTNPDDVTIITKTSDDVEGNVVIISYDLVSKKQKELQDTNFRFLILDESHFIKNRNAIRTQAVLKLAKKAKRVLLLSGTPALSRPAELFTQISAVNPAMFSGFMEYAKRYCNAKQMPWGWDFSGSSCTDELQVLLEETVMIRRTKKDVLDQLQPKQRQCIVLDPRAVKTSVCAKTAARLKHSQSQRLDERSALLAHFSVTGTAKLPAICDYVADLLESNQKMLVFGHHHDVLDGLQDLLLKKKVSFVRIDGQVSSQLRKQYVDEFQLNEEIRVALLSITACCSGISLTAANLVVFAELFWNPGILVQAEDRVYRIGQNDSVSIHYLIAHGTADDLIWPLVQKKLDFLGKVGLSKDDFSSAGVSNFSDPHQRSILSFIQNEMMTDMDLVTAEPSGHSASEPAQSSTVTMDVEQSTSRGRTGIDKYLKSSSKPQSFVPPTSKQPKITKRERQERREEEDIFVGIEAKRLRNDELYDF